MRSLTLLSVLIASILATPVVNFENSLNRRAATRKEDLVGDSQITEEEASLLADFDILGLFNSGDGFFSNVLGLNIGALSDRSVVEKRGKELEMGDDPIAAGVTLLQDENNESRVKSDTDTDVDADFGVDADFDA